MAAVSPANAVPPSPGLTAPPAACGRHWAADLGGCDAARPAMRDPDALRALCTDATAAAGLHAVGALFHGFAGGGVTGVVLLAESHLAVHTWPEREAATIDLHVCNVGRDNTAAGAALVDALALALGARSTRLQSLDRALPGLASPVGGTDA